MTKTLKILLIVIIVGIALPIFGVTVILTRMQGGSLLGVGFIVVVFLGIRAILKIPNRPRRYPSGPKKWIAADEKEENNIKSPIEETDNTVATRKKIEGETKAIVLCITFFWVVSHSFMPIKTIGEQPSGAVKYNSTGPVDYFLPPEGFGESRFDKRVSHPWTQLNDLNEFRASCQSGFEKIVFGMLKGIGLAGSISVDCIFGSIPGVINVIDDATSGKYARGYVTDENDEYDLNEKGNKVKNKRENPLVKMIANSYINNPVSSTLREIEETQEKLLPNYYTNKERRSDVFGQIFTANFWGDKVNKNLGFVAGIVLSMIVLGKIVCGIADTIKETKNTEKTVETETDSIQ